MKKATEKISVFEQAAGGYLLLLTLLLPLKFGTLAVLPEAASFFPEGVFSYLVVSWPAHAFGIVSGVGLLLALVAFPPRNGLWRTPAGWCALLWGIGLPLISLLGWINAETLDYALGESAHLAGTGAFALAVCLMLDRHPQWRNRFFTLIVVGVGCLAFSGLYQYFYGFRETQKYVEEQIAAGARISDVMLSKIYDDRVFATFVSCNALAGYLLLTLPPALAVIRRCARYFEPVQVSRWLLPAAFGAAPVAVLLLTRTRGALLAILVTAGVGVMLLPMKRLWRFALIGAAVLVLVAGAFAVRYAGRGFGSMGERVSYLATSGQMMAEKPLLGYGWGGFFYRHMQLKDTATNESAHDPHNLVLSFATQCGVVGGVVALAALLVPLTLLGLQVARRDPARPWWIAPVFFGEFAFLFHALMEVSLQIPAAMAMAGALFPAALQTDSSSGGTDGARAGRIVAFAGLGVVAVAAFALNFLWLRGEIAFNDLSAAARPQSAEEMARGVSPDEIVALLRRNRQLRPWSPFPWEAAGDYFMRIGDGETAERCFREALKRTASRPSIHVRLFETARLRGDLKAAREHLLEVRRLFPGNTEYRELAEKFDPSLVPVGSR